MRDFTHYIYIKYFWVIKLRSIKMEHGYMMNAYDFSRETLGTQALKEQTKIDLRTIRYDVGEWEMYLRAGVNVRLLRIQE